MPNNIQTIIDKFDKEFGGEKKHLSDYYVNDVKQFLSQAIDQTREETIRECEDGLPTPHFLNGLAKADYSGIQTKAFENGVFQTYQRIKKSLINLRSK